MKSKRIITIVISLVIGFCVGLISGLSLTNPGLSLREAAGTIGRVDQYRNVRITQQDIELRNELAEDMERRDAFISYLAYEYARNVRTVENVGIAVRSGEAVGGFRTANLQTMEQLNQYVEFLDNVRLRILEAMGTLQDLGERDRVAVHSVLKDAGNALAQNSLREGVLFDFLLGVERFFKTASPGQYPELASAHDWIFASLVSDNLVKGNRPALEHLLAKRPLGEEDLLGAWDAERLRSQLLADNEKLGFFDAEKLGRLPILDSEQLGRLPILDSEQLGILFDAEQLGLFYDAEQLGILFDMEKLGVINDAGEQLQRIIFF